LLPDYLEKGIYLAVISKALISISETVTFVSENRLSMQKNCIYLSCFIFCITICSCGQADEDHVIPEVIDVHTYAQPGKAVATHLSLKLTADFSLRVLRGLASYTIKSEMAADKIIFDVNGLEIDSVHIVNNSGSLMGQYSIGEYQPFMGAPLSITIDTTITGVDIYYSTKSNAAALQWLSPQQTQGKTHPFLFTQGQAILTRTWIPCQDSPGIRFTYDAVITVPPQLLPVMSASNPTVKNETGIYTFEMQQPIPAYLMALAIGDIEFTSLGSRTGVYAEPGVLQAAAYEFADMDNMLEAAESLYGPYLWDRYDLIVLPPSFPFGGMENPRLTFATPTIIAGDRSLTSLVAHELAHSWSGNLVTNATWDDFWLNEGFTNYFERRIMESLYGEDYTNMLWLLGFQDLQGTIEDLGVDHPDTHLKLSLEGRDPDEGMTDIAYEKGSLMLRSLEEKVGRETFDQFLKEYFESFKFETISTEAWIPYTKKYLLNPNKVDFDLEAWIYSSGIPADAASIRSDKLANVDQRLKEFIRIGRLDASQGKSWSTHEWLHFLKNLSIDLHVSFYEKLDEVFALSSSGNAEILAAWLEISIWSGYLHGHNQEILEEFLTEVGRRKFLVPLYRALIESNDRTLAAEIFEKAKANYHSISANSIADLIATAQQVG